MVTSINCWILIIISKWAKLMVIEVIQLAFTCSKQQWKHQIDNCNMFKVTNKDIRKAPSLASFWCLHF